MEAILNQSETKYSRQYFMELVERARTEEDIADLVTLFDTLTGNEVELALPSFCLLAEKCPDSVKLHMMNLVHCTLTDVNSLRSSRKAATACLKILTRSEEPVWINFFTLLQCLEEPQFHIINPVLPLLDVVLQSVYSCSLPFKWAEVLFIRALTHSNGWIRLWALEKLMAVEPRFLTGDKNFAFSTLLSHLDSNDLFWRLLERQKLKPFLKSFVDMFEGVALSLEESNRGDFIKDVLRNVCRVSNPSSLFFISQALKEISCLRFLCLDDFPLMKTLLQRTQCIQHNKMRVATLFNFVLSFSKLLEVCCETANEIGNLTAFFSRDDPSLLRTFTDMKSSRELLHEDLKSINMIQLALDYHREFQKDDFAHLLWVRASLSNQEHQLQKLIELELADRLTAIEDGVDVALSTAMVDDVDTLLNMLYSSYRALDAVDHGLVQLIHGYILLRCAVTTATEMEFYIIHTVYIGLLRRLKFSFKPITELAFTLISEEGIPLCREALLVKVLAEVYDDLGSDDRNCILPKIARYLGDNTIMPPPRTLNTGYFNGKDVNKALSALHEHRLKLLIKCFPVINRRSADELLRESIECLECASAYPVAECCLELAAVVVNKVTSSQTLFTLVKAATHVMNEERKSQNFLPALRHTLSLCLNKSVMVHSEVRDFVMQKYSDLLKLAYLNTPVALLLSQSLLDVVSTGILSKEWANIVFTLAVFGPIPKKEQRVLNAAYEMIYENCPNDFNDLHKPFEVLQRTRLNGICIALHLSKNNPVFARHLISHIIAQTNSLNESSSRSFGLSLAHRQNTRAASLLLFVMDYVQEEDVIDAVFSNCVDWIVDPCQQFSIKLQLEWLLVRLTYRSLQLKQRLIQLERTLASKRIGSVTSWINMIVLMSRLETNKASLASYVELILPWTTAQNFAVRCTAVAGLRLIYKRIPKDGSTRCSLLQRIVNFDGEPNGNSKRIINNLVADFYFGHLHPVKHFDMQTVLHHLPVKTGMPSEETVGLDLLKRFNTSAISSCNDDTQFLSASSLVYSALSKNNKCCPDISQDEIDRELLEDGGSSLVQRKIVTEERRLHEDCSLIVVASLVDKPNNLGGLCRTCEIFGVDVLVIADPIFTMDSGFKALSMSSEKKQKIEAVRLDGLPEYLESMRKKGYTVIAAEQTNDSIFLHKFKFPKKTVLLVGDEKEGVPVHLLRCVDQTVEIQQLGQTRSLNVHVSAALFIAKYTEQILLVDQTMR